MTERYGDLLRLLAGLLEYPNEELLQKAKGCQRLVAELRPGAAGDMDGFVAYLEGESTGRLEELYTTTFDLKPQCYPYAGYQLFGDEDPKRSQLMVKLRESYQAEDFHAGDELPDHVPLLLRFVAYARDEELKRDLEAWVLAPVLQKMAQTLETKNNPYGKAVAAAAVVITTP